MSILRVRLFGGVSVEIGDDVFVDLATQKSRSLFGFLIVNQGRVFERAVLAAMLWPNVPDSFARKSLRNEIWRIRTAVRPAGIGDDELFTVEANRIGIARKARLWTDVGAFKAALESADDSRRDDISTVEERWLTKAVQLYLGPLMAGCFDDWCVLEREVLRDRFLSALEVLMRHHQGRSNWKQAIDLAKRLLRDDPLLEHVHRDLMCFYCAAGDRPAALRHYQNMSRMLRRDLGVAPMPGDPRVLLGPCSQGFHRLRGRSASAGAVVSAMDRADRGDLSPER